MSTSECTIDDDGCKNGDQADWVSSTSTATVFIGAVVGQLTMGYLGDLFSRNLALCWTLIIAAISSLLSAILSHGSPEAVYGIIIAFRFTLGVGLGGVYPLAATKASEDGSRTGQRAKDSPSNSQAAGWSYFWQLPGLFLPWFFGYCFTYSNLSTSAKWRLILALGSIPSIITVILLLIEAKYEQGSIWSILIAEKKPADSTKPELTYGQMMELLREDDNGRKLFLCGFAWFLFDVVMYGIGLLTGHIISTIDGDDDNVSANSSIRNISSKQMIAASVTIIFAFGSIFLISVIGLKKLQTLSFLIVSFFCMLLASVFDYLEAHDGASLFGLYCLAYASLNFGLGATTYAYPAAVFPKKVRSTFNGIASACGKIGAAVGAFSFIYIGESSAGYPGVLGLCSCFAIIGAFVTFFLTHHGDVRDLVTMHEIEGQQESMLMDGDSSIHPLSTNVSRTSHVKHQNTPLHDDRHL